MHIKVIWGCVEDFGKGLKREQIRMGNTRKLLCTCGIFTIFLGIKRSKFA